jgi:L-threonylcarbamoyladenylate synthase
MNFAPLLIADDASVTQAAEILRGGGLIAFPTETVYGLGGHALDERAVARIFEAKGRPRFDPLIVHVVNVEAALRLFASFPTLAQRLAERFWPGPLTLVLPKRKFVPDLVTAGADTVAIRVPDHPVAQALLRAAGVPVAAPSANPFGRISPTTAQHVAEQLGDRIDLILDGGPCRVGIESTVVQITDAGPRLLRPGGLTTEALEAVVGPMALGGTPSTAQRSPGTLAQHYAPVTPLVLADGPEQVAALADQLAHPVGLLTLNESPHARWFSRVEVLSHRGSLVEATAGFFAALRRLDSAGLACIVAQLFREEGLGRALNDRLRRASAA